jgi:microcystin-dependent protein
MVHYQAQLNKIRPGRLFMSEFFLGTVMPWPADLIPAGWSLCDGRLQAISQNQALYSLLGKRYGGNGFTTFGLPDFRGRVIMGSQAYHYPGSQGGHETMNLSVEALPAHSHYVNLCASKPAETNDPTNGPIVLAKPARNAYASSGQQAMQAGNSTSIGLGQPITVMQPFLVLNYIICIDGEYPSRS